MAAAESGSESKSLFSLDAYHVSEELGFILPDPLVGGTLFTFYILPYTYCTTGSPNELSGFQESSVFEMYYKHEFKWSEVLHVQYMWKMYS